jgi:hypothetical protein
MLDADDRQFAWLATDEASAWVRGMSSAEWVEEPDAVGYIFGEVEDSTTVEKVDSLPHDVAPPG